MIETVSIDEVKRLSKGHFFSDGAMKFFNSRLGLTAWKYRDGYLFFTSEKGPDGVRRYSVRYQDGLGNVHTKGDFQAHSTARQAVTEIKKLLSEGKRNMLKDQIDLTTQQQETGHKEWTESESSLEFWEFYAAWCLENGLFNDRASHQTSMIREL